MVFNFITIEWILLKEQSVSDPTRKENTYKYRETSLYRIM